MVLLSGPAGAWLAIGADTQVPKEYQLKAAFLFNFLKFVEWPASRFGSADEPIVLGVFGDNPFGAGLENTVRDRKISGRGIVVRSVQNTADAKATHLLFVSAAEESRFGALREDLKAAGVLTVGESESFLKRGGIISFTIEGDKLRFDINMISADKAGLKISAQLQKLAKNVLRKP